MKQNHLLAAGVCLLLAAALTASSLRHSSPEAFYAEHQDALHTAAQQILTSGTVQDISVEGVRQIDAWAGPPLVIEFYLSGSGLGPSTHYKGLYYSPEDVPAAFQNVSAPLEPSDVGWTWTDGTDNHGSTTRVAPCWYTFEAHF